LTRLIPVDIQRVAEVMADQAAVSGDPARYLRDLVARAELPPQWRNQVIGSSNGNLAIATREIVRWAAARGVNPADPRFTVLGSVLAPLLDDIGPDVAADVVAVIVSYGLFRHGRPRVDLLARFQVPIPTTQSDVDGSEWEADTVLQRRAGGTPLLDVGSLAEGIRRSAAVCRVEAGADIALGTGFLVGPDTALTAQHVVAAANGQPLRLRLRCTTSSAGTLVALDAERPVAASSPVGELDFALLRLAASATLPEGTVPLRLDDAPPPQVGDPIAILQHPDGAPMRLAVSANSVTRLDLRRHAIRYHTVTAYGSSGGPCFDEAWRAVAVHQAEHATVFGAVREGVLLSTIHARIRHLLSRRDHI
jgi:hypothetical protein